MPVTPSGPTMQVSTERPSCSTATAERIPLSTKCSSSRTSPGSARISPRRKATGVVMASRASRSVGPSAAINWFGPRLGNITTIV